VQHADLSPHAQIAHDLLHGRSAAVHPAVSPDGARVACVVATVDVERNTTQSRVWLDGSPITDGPHDGNPAWSPDGRWLAFTSRRGEKKGDSTLHVIPVGGPGETRTVCTMPDGLEYVAWSPDGRWIAFLSRTRDERYDAEDASWQSPRKVERFFGRLNGEDWVFDRPRHVHVVAADGTGAPRNLTPGEFQHDDLAWLPDSTGVIVSAGRHDAWDLDLAVDLHRVPLDGEIVTLTEQTGAYSHAAPSPDGTWLAFVGIDDSRTYPQNGRVGVMRPDGSDRRWISEGLDRTFLTLTGLRAPVWIDGRTLIAAAEDRGEQHLYRLDLDGNTPERLTSGAISVVAWHAAGGTLATAVSRVDRTSDVFVERAGRTEQITSVSAEAHLPWERFAVPCTDGSDEIDAWIMRPADFDPTRRYPVLLNVHGGPFTQYGEVFFDEAQMQARAGFVVVMSNPRGGSGRHTAWGQSIMGPKHERAPGTGWGSVDVDDVLAVLDAAIDRYPFCDRDRVGMLGGSYGGYMATTLAARHGDRFRAICSERAVNNLLTEEWSSDIGSMFQVEHGPDPVADPDEYLRMSPIRLARDIHVPMLIIHSEEDWRCPINQAEELWMTLRMLGRDVTFYRFPGENHELSRGGSPLHRRMRGEIILDFFARHLMSIAAAA
jgi:dipeptidyl aminopeptidase/acylaminoacyl peptidase